MLSTHMDRMYSYSSGLAPGKINRWKHWTRATYQL